MKTLTASKVLLRICPLLALAATTGALRAANAAAPDGTITINADKVTAQVSSMLFGFMTEEINYCYDGGLYAELISNRNFQGSPTDLLHWSMVLDPGANGTIALDDTTTLNDKLPKSLKLTATTAAANQRVGIANDGFWGMAVKPSTSYKLTFYAKASGNFTGPLTVAISSTNSPVTYAYASVPKISGDWQKYEVTLQTDAKVTPTKDADFLIWTNSPGTVNFGFISLFPPTYNNRPNGMRPDIMQLLGDYKPAFLRFPGGNYLEGNSIATHWDWKKTIGDIAQRSGHYNDAWSYPSSDGVGLLEFMEWCEDLKIEPVMGIYAGYSMRGGVVPQLDPYVQDGLDQLEYCMGDASTKWGAERAKDGHPAPFKVNYVEIGNEDNLGTAGRSYNDRYRQFYNAIKAKYPDIKIIASDGLKRAGVDQRTNVKTVTPDLVDDHYYPAPAAMKNTAFQYDVGKYPHDGAPKVFVGEYATRMGNNGPLTSSLEYALCDAAFLTGLERNADLVRMASYAPLFINVNMQNDPQSGRIWRTDLIGYDALNSYGSASYYAQKMLTHNHGDTTVDASLDGLVSSAQTNFFYSVTRDSKDGTIYLAVVNINDTPRSVKIDLKGVSSVAAEGQATVLTSGALADTNSIAEPTKVAPATSKESGLSASFTRVFPPQSFTILNIPAK